MSERYLLDTSSLLSLIRYYQPFDRSGILKSFIKEKFENGEFIFLRSVFDECQKVSGGKIIREYPFLKDSSIKKVKNMTATRQQHKKMDDCSDKGWCVSSQKKRLGSSKFQTTKQRYIDSADFNLIATAASESNMAIVTEEAVSENDRKPFKKIPAICEIEGINCINLPELLKVLQLSTDYQFINNPK